MRIQTIIFGLAVVLFSCGKSEDVNVAPDQPVLKSPLGDATCESLKPTFSWEATDPEEDDLLYTIWLGTSESNLSIVEENLQNPRYIPSSNLLAATVYYWQVEAHDAKSSTKSEIETFSTTGEGESGTIPSRPLIVAPTSNTAAGSISFSWNASTNGVGAITYDLYVKHASEQNYTLLEGGLTSTTYTSDFNAGSLSWYVEAIDSRGQLSQSAIISIVLN